jgi:hypothetical protein
VLGREGVAALAMLLATMYFSSLLFHLVAMLRPTGVPHLSLSADPLSGASSCGFGYARVSIF